MELIEISDFLKVEYRIFKFSYIEFLKRDISGLVFFFLI